MRKKRRILRQRLLRKEASSEVQRPWKRTHAETKALATPSSSTGKKIITIDGPPRSSFVGPPTRGIARPKVFDNDFLRALGVYDGVVGYFEVIG